MPRRDGVTERWKAEVEIEINEDHDVFEIESGWEFSTEEDAIAAEAFAHTAFYKGREAEVISHDDEE